jgi:hypothetical protein
MLRAAALVVVLFATPAFAQDDYLDDRSTGTAVIKSFYNAINRQEYVRAWDYFQHDVDPDQTQVLVAPFTQFQAGYADTASVTLLTGEEVSEGAAGSLYYSVPVAIDAVSTSGEHTQFAGCYTLRLVQPLLQETPPYKPLHIDQADLKPAKGELADILPASCEN